jgi:hypothetical protein
VCVCVYVCVGAPSQPSLPSVVCRARGTRMSIILNSTRLYLTRFVCNQKHMYPHSNIRSQEEMRSFYNAQEANAVVELVTELLESKTCEFLV